MTRLFRVYEPWECGPDGYPLVWHRIEGEAVDSGNGYAVDVAAKAWSDHAGYVKPPVGGWGVKHIVRAAAEDRCERCGHPFVVGQSGVMEESDDLHARRSERETGFPQEALDAALLEQIADGEIDLDPAGARRTLWSPCDERCTHQGPFRYRFHESHDWTLVPEPPRGELPVQDGSYVLWRAANRPTIEAAWRVLTVHHLNGRKHDLRWWNLCSLCQRCHLYIQRKVQMERVWPWEHTDWFKPHAAGYYAYAYLGEDLTREQVAERQDELLALERAA